MSFSIDDTLIQYGTMDSARDGTTISLARGVLDVFLLSLHSRVRRNDVLCAATHLDFQLVEKNRKRNRENIAVYVRRIKYTISIQLAVRKNENSDEMSITKIRSLTEKSEYLAPSNRAQRRSLHK